jgi:iron complex outermembrane receptor protein
MPPGTYKIQSTFIGFTAVVKSVQVVAGGTVTVNFQLEEDVLALSAILVTGTRSRGRTAIESPVPIDTFTGPALERQGNGDMTETLKNVVPSFAATPLTGDGAAFVRPTSLRGLPPDDVLILVNSKRRHRSALISHFGAAMNVGAHAADIGQIPSIALKNLEVLRDGASAQYGSDAIAGVMNFILKDASQGVEIQTQTSQWYDGETDLKVAGNIGLPLTENGFINLSGEYTFNPELSRGVQHASAIGVLNARNPAMNWGRPKSRGLRTVWNAGLELNQNAQLYSFGNFADTYGNYSFFYRAPGHSALQPVPLDPTDPSQGNFSWGDTFPAGFTPRFEGFQTDFSLVAGLKGNFDNGLVYDLSGTYGSNRIDYKLNGSLNPSFGPESQLVFRPGDLKQEDLNLNLDLSYAFQNNFNLAGGFEFRQETYALFAGEEQSWKAGPWADAANLIDPTTGENYAAPPVGANGFSGTSADNAGEFDSKNWAVYLDGEWDVSDEFLLQAAVRHEDFNEFGTTNDFKLASRYTVSDKLTLRGAVSTGFRAPTPGQANVVTIVTSFDGVTGQQVQEGTIKPTDPLAVSLGGKALVPEDALNISLGLASRVTQSLNFTADYYRIRVNDRIIKSRALPVTGDPNFSEVAFYTNSLETRTQGLDVVATWSSGANTDISLAYNYNKTDVVRQDLVNGQQPVSDGSVFNIENNLPKHRATATLNQKFRKLSTTLRANFYGGTKDERGGDVGDDHEEVGSEVLVDLEFGYPVTPDLTLVGGANNLFDNFPDEISTRLSQGMPYPRRTPIGYHGGSVYMRAIYKF